MPALLTRMSIRPKASTTLSMAASTCTSLVTSMATAIARPPSRLSSASARWAPAESRSAMASLAPAREKVRAICLPIPLAAPVTTATLSLRRISLISMRSSFPVSREEGVDRRQTLRLIEQRRVPTIRDGDVLKIRLLADHARHRRGAEQIGERSAYHQHGHALDRSEEHTSELQSPCNLV